MAALKDFGYLSDFGESVELFVAASDEQVSMFKAVCNGDMYERGVHRPPFPVTWIQVLCSPWCCIDDGKTFLLFRLAALNGHLVGFYEPTSGYVDYEAITRWFQTRYPSIPWCRIEDLEKHDAVFKEPQEVKMRTKK